jgi:hypothetical protein
MEWKRYAVLIKQYQGRGALYINQLLLITVNAKVFENYLKIFGLTVTSAIVIGFSFTILLGWADYHYGIWLAENDYVWKITPSADETLKVVQRIEKSLGERK